MLKFQLFIVFILGLHSGPTNESSFQSYYKNIDFEQNPTEIRNRLYTLLNTSQHTVVHYSSKKFLDSWDVLMRCEKYDTGTHDVLLFYGYNDTDRYKFNDRVRSEDSACHQSNCENLWNREHVFPRSKIIKNDNYPDIIKDLHNLRASDPKMNTKKGNRKFGLGKLESGINPKGEFFPGEEWKGDVARTIMYMCLKYPENCLSNQVTKGCRSYNFKCTMSEMFLKWNEEDPVSQIEINRNEKIYKVQGNRNPFIDFPELARKIWSAN